MFTRYPALGTDTDRDDIEREMFGTSLRGTSVLWEVRNYVFSKSEDNKAIPVTRCGGLCFL
jgi:hypothetical protein